MSIVISAEHISKKYRIGSINSRSLRDDILRGWARLRGRSVPVAKIVDAPEPLPDQETLWALRDVNFEINNGETVGIIGRNGAGKSTLLKILSHITSPTEGKIKIKGRTSSLLEVGIGFHPELTGRENIYLNGAIMGMNRAEVSRKFDEILDFSGIEKFIDTPVKRYSTGMYMRLAFAVAAHLEPEILIVDEVLAVGDAAFQKKCLGKMKDVSHHGRTVLFVSHNIGAITSLCNRCLWLDKGLIVKDGATTEVAEAYQSRFNSTASDPSDLSLVERYGSGKARFTSLKITPVDSHGEAQPVFITGNDLKVELTIEAKEDMGEANVALIFYDATGFRLIDVNTALQGCYLSLKSGQHAQIEFQLHDVFLKPGPYFLGLWLGRHNFEDIDGITSVTSFTIEPNLGALKHSINFPGAYQCQFSQQVKII